MQSMPVVMSYVPMGVVGSEVDTDAWLALSINTKPQECGSLRAPLAAVERAAGLP